MALNGSWTAISGVQARAASVTPFPMPQWTRGSVRLPFNIGSFNLFAAELPGLICDDVHEPGAGGWAPTLDEETAVGVVRNAFTANLWDKPSEALLRLNLFRYLGPPLPRFCVSLTGSFANYLKKFSPKTQSTLRRKLRRLNEASENDVDCLEYRATREIAEFCEICRQVQIGAYATEILKTDIWPHREELMGWAANGLTRCYALFAKKKPIAYLCCCLEGMTVVYWISAYDPSYSHYSPGVLLQLLALEKLFAEQRFELFDFMTGSGQHKQFFATENLEVVDVYYFKRTPANFALVAGHRAFRATVRQGERVLRAVRLDPVLRRLRRRIATTPQGVAFWRRHQG